MQKRYEYKVYSTSWTFKKTIAWWSIINDLSFNASINSGQNDCVIDINIPFNDTSIVYGDIIKVYAYTDLHPTGILMYTWYVSIINRILAFNKETIRLSLLWLWMIMHFIYAKIGGVYTFTKNQDPALTIIDIVNYFNTVYTAPWLNTNGIINYWSNINYSFNYTKCLAWLKNITALTDRYFYIKADWTVIFNTRQATPKHLFTVWKDVNSIDISDDSESVVNSYSLTYSAGTVSAIDIASQTNYWLRELRETKTSIVDLASANSSASKYIASNKDFKRKIKIVVNNSYDIETIDIWDTVSVLNTNLQISNLQIVKLSYNKDTVVIHLEDFNSLVKTLIP